MCAGISVTQEIPEEFNHSINIFTINVVSDYQEAALHRTKYKRYC